MLGKMMTQQLTISSLIAHAARYHAGTEVVSVETDGGLYRSNWGEVELRTRKLASALEALGIEKGDRCATIAWNNMRHLEIYFGVAGAGMICHTINPRLFPEQLIYIINHAEDKVLFLDSTFLPVVAKLGEHLKTLRHVVLMGPRNEEAAAMVPGLKFYDELIETGKDDYVWPDIDENSSSSLCYTSGTTGNPKGVLYTHRSTVLHSIAGNQPDGLALSARESVMPVVPMFHVNAWGIPYMAPAAGSKLVLPGPNLDGDSLVKLIDQEGVTLALGVPTIWMGLLHSLEKLGSKAESLTRTVIGGSACPPSMITAFREKFGVEVMHAWGMSETSPLGTMNKLLKKHETLSEDEQNKIREGQGRPPFGVELRIVDDEGHVLPNDGETQGELQIRGHWIVDTYFKVEKTALTLDGWFDTGDVATIDPDGFMIIRDRSKDIIKSGGEWISTVELENIAIGHPGVANAAAIAARHEKWDERPVLVVLPVTGATPSEEELLAFYDGKIAKWQIPDRVIFVDALPIGGTGKVLKNKLRDEFGDVLIKAE
ncbi:Long-chain-fatty-acid--CoA ligase [Thalassovita gelatinovora]|uniref:Long-chain-fatty-acid--CoA ligase n=1 Tax=Thalassovita gelatinovora TaxID=53501 RepID=A0A0P1G5B0_THAGE|nr:long-chain-fatty-acid--CoA ligase [Thalassovita gelatinovora]QIZ79047.1 long-chain-fatty-acid--CoA ligase [Thalassovita gelatinovora]CUH68639.1 Long-chain-fatty-acid--CoA ligase [Thalassovita gelatinovora]SEQ55922.1 methylmercaptopropionate CoA ligase [Thalassovita gelatinovora]